MITVIISSDEHLKKILDWLKNEQHKTGEGFYCNREIIVDSHKKGEVHVAIESGIVIGFVVDHLYSLYHGSSIDILEVHPNHRNRGVGKVLALDSISRLFELGADLVNVECAPSSSEAFWLKLGFKPKGDFQTSIRGNPKLVFSKTSKLS